jgi:hypothetical protein
VVGEDPAARFTVERDVDFSGVFVVRTLDSSCDLTDDSSLFVHDLVTLFLVRDGFLHIESHFPFLRADFIVFSLEVFSKSTEDDRPSLRSVESCGGAATDSREFHPVVGKRLLPASDLLGRSSLVIAATSVDGERLAVLSFLSLVLLSVNLHVFAGHRIVMVLHLFSRGHLSLEPGMGFNLSEGVTLLRILVQHSNQ